MRIIHCAPHCHDVGNGVVNVAVDLACKQAEAGHAVAFVSNPGALCDLLARYRVRHFCVDHERRTPAAMGRAIIRFRQALSSFDPDIVHAHTVPSALYSSLARVGMHCRIVTTLHNSPGWQAVLMGLGDKVVAVSAAVAESMTRRGIPARKIRVIKNGPLGSPRRDYRNGCTGMTVRRPSITTVARLFKQKGIDVLIAAFESIAPRFPAAALYILGEGPERNLFEAQAAKTACADRIRFLGFSKDPRVYLAQSDIFVLASRADPFPLVIPEAREAGCAIIASAVDGIPEALEDGTAGILVPPSDPAALAQALARLLVDPAELAQWRHRAAENIEWLRLDRVVQETINVYEEALGRDRGEQIGSAAISARPYGN
jgi:glycosyltransferase involved in cell wall biosynthesis